MPLWERKTFVKVILLIPSYKKEELKIQRNVKIFEENEN